MMEIFGPNFAYGYLLVGVIIGFVVGRITAPRKSARDVGGNQSRGPLGSRHAAPKSSAEAPVEFEIGGRRVEVGPAAMNQIRQFIAGSKKIEAIKHLREETGIGLAEAKELVEAIQEMER